jgi:hypothetical protein
MTTLMPVDPDNLLLTGEIPPRPRELQQLHLDRARRAEEERDTLAATLQRVVAVIDHEHAGARVDPKDPAAHAMLYLVGRLRAALREPEADR